MSRSVTYKGITFVRAGGYTFVDPSGADQPSLGASGVVVVIGEAEGGKPEEGFVFRNVDTAREVLRSGDLLDGISALFAPANDDRITAGASQIISYKTNVSTQAVSYFGSLTADKATADIVKGTGALTTLAGLTTANDGDLLLGPDGKFYLIVGVDTPTTAATITPVYQGTTVTGSATEWTVAKAFAKIESVDYGEHNNRILVQMEFDNQSGDSDASLTYSFSDVDTPRAYSGDLPFTRTIEVDDAYMPISVVRMADTDNAGYCFYKSGTNYVFDFYNWGAAPATPAVPGDVADVTLTYAASIFENWTVGDFIGQLNNDLGSDWEAQYAPNQWLPETTPLFTNDHQTTTSTATCIFDIQNAVSGSRVMIDGSSKYVAGTERSAARLWNFRYAAYKFLAGTADFVSMTTYDYELEANGITDVTTNLIAAERGYTTKDSISNIMTLVKKLKESTRFNAFVPCFAKDIPTTSSGLIDWFSMMATLKDDIKAIASVTGKNECMAYMGYVPDSKSGLAALGAYMNTEYIQCYITGVQRPVSPTNVITWCEPWMTACIAAGIASGSPVGTSLTHKYANCGDIRVVDENGAAITGLDVINNAEDIILMGFNHLEVVSGKGTRFLRDITTYTKRDNDVLTERNLVETWLYIAYETRVYLEGVWTGEKSLSGSAALFRSDLETILGIFVSDSLLTTGVDKATGKSLAPYREVVVSMDSDIVYYSFTCSPTPSINFQFMNMKLARAGSSA